MIGGMSVKSSRRQFLVGAGVAAGAKQHSEVKEHKYPVVGPKPIGRMLQGGVVDPFGHMWLIGKFLD